MKNKIPTLLLSLSLTALVGFTVGQEIELDQYLNARANPNFLKYAKNVQTTLAKGTKGEVLEVKKLPSGNSGIKMKVTSGPKAGKSYWVYYNKQNPALKLVNQEDKKPVTPDEVTPEKKADAQTVRDTPARRDLDEQAVDGVAADAVEVTGKGKAAVNPNLGSDGCPIVPATTEKKPELPNVPPIIVPPQESYSPMQALSDLNNGELKFIGRAILPGSDQNSTCVYKNDKAYVLYGNCMASRKEAVATDITVISMDGRIFHYYNEPYGATTKPSQLKRSQYDGSWTLDFKKADPPGNLDMTAMKAYVAKSNSLTDGACFIGETGKAKDMGQKAKCFGGFAKYQDEWANSTESFWQEPGEEWYATQNKLRKIVETTKY